MSSHRNRIVLANNFAVAPPIREARTDSCIDSSYLEIGNTHNLSTIDESLLSQPNASFSSKYNNYNTAVSLLKSPTNASSFTNRSSIVSSQQLPPKYTKRMVPPVYAYGGGTNMASQSLLSSYSQATGATVGAAGGSRAGISSSSSFKIHAGSTSLSARKASMASVKSSIQQEYRDLRVHRKLASIQFGRARRPYMIAVALFALAGVLFVIGLVVLCLRQIGNLFLSLDKGEIIGPLFMASSLVFVGGGIKFMYEAFRIASLERKSIGVRSTNNGMVSMTRKKVGGGLAPPAKSAPTSYDAKPEFSSGTTTRKALIRVPINSYEVDTSIPYGSSILTATQISKV